MRGSSGGSAQPWRLMPELTIRAEERCISLISEERTETQHRLRAVDQPPAVVLSPTNMCVTYPFSRADGRCWIKAGGTERQRRLWPPT